MSTKQIFYLASSSPRRRDILKKMRIPFQVVRTLYHEKKIPNAPPEKLVMWHAASKARKAVIPRGVRFVIGADTVVVYKGEILGKPRNQKDAIRMLNMLSGDHHYVFTGMSIIDHQTHDILTGCAITKVHFKKLSDKAILDYFKKVNPLDKAGAYAIQEGPKIVRKIEGSYSNVVGFPVELFRKMMKDIKKS